MDSASGRSFSRFGNDIQVLVDVDEFVGSFAINVVIPFAHSPLLRVDGAVWAEERLEQAIVIAIVPNLMPNQNINC